MEAKIFKTALLNNRGTVRDCAHYFPFVAARITSDSFCRDIQKLQSSFSYKNRSPIGKEVFLNLNNCHSFTQATGNDRTYVPLL